MLRCLATTFGLIMIPAALTTGYAADTADFHLRVLRGAYGEFSQPMAQGEMRASVYTPVHGLTHDVYVVWQGGHEYVEITDYHAEKVAPADHNQGLIQSTPRLLRSVVGPDGTMLVHEPAIKGERRVANISRNQQKRLMDGSAKLIPEPHVAWYQLTWGGQTPWDAQLKRMTSGAVDVSVADAPMPDGDVQLNLRNQSNGFEWQLTYSPTKGGRIVSYGPRDSELRTTWQWDHDAENRWFLREYRHFPMRSGQRPATSDQPFVIHVHEFSFEPEIPANRFRFESIPLPDGTILYEQRAGTRALKRTVVGRDPNLARQPSLADFNRLSELLTTSGFGEASGE